MATLIGEEWEFVVKERPLKVRRFSNGSIQIVEENLYYQNLSFAGDTYHVSEECIWAESDFYEFCRLSTGRFHTIRAMSELYITVYNLSAGNNRSYSAENAHLRQRKAHQGSTPLKVAEVYSGGDYCGEPINKARNTTVEYTCGNSWFSIKNISETSPCEYRMEVESRLLCESSFEETLAEESSKNTICFS